MADDSLSHDGGLRRLSLALAASGLILTAEVLGAIVSHSLSLLADAAHMVTDVGAVALALWAAQIAGRPPDTTRTFGYGRSKVLAAFVNGAALFAIVVFLAIEAVKRLQSPSPVNQGVMLWIDCARGERCCVALYRAWTQPQRLDECSSGSLAPVW